MIGFRQTGFCASSVLMPKASVHEDYTLEAGEDNIGGPRQVFTVEPKTQPGFMKK